MAVPSVLILCGSYLPGFKGGGPIQSVAGLVDALRGEFRFGVITSDRDVGDRQPYPGVRPGAWQSHNEVPVLYVEAGRLSPRTFMRAVHDFNADIVYLNSYFSPRFSILPLLCRRFGRNDGRAVVLAPRGEFSPGALAIKQRKKHAYARVERALGLTDGVLFQASSSDELINIRRFIGTHARVAVARNLSPRAQSGEGVSRPGRQHAGIRLIFLSRIVPKKNLDGAIRMLGGIKGPVEFAICGPTEDAGYWKKCQALIATLPPNVSTTYLGPVSAAEVPTVLANHDFLFLPTHGENHGHVIAEALSAGTPVIVSDQTPWQDLEAEGAGWSIPLEAPEAWAAALEACRTMTDDQYSRMSARAREYVAEALNPEARVAEHRALFHMALQGRSVRSDGDAAQERGGT